MKKILFTITLFLTMSIAATISAQDKSIIYIGDPMCSWCYGFGPEISKIKAEFPEVDFQIVMGGLRPYGKETMESLSDFLKKHWKEIEEKTGQEFSYDILGHPDFIYDTEPASRAVVVMRDLKPAKTLEFFKAVQKLFYKENKDTRNVMNYEALVSSYGVDFDMFKSKFLSEEYQAKTKEDFIYAQKMGIRGFPSMVMKVGAEYFLLSNGFAPAASISDKIKNMK